MSINELIEQLKQLSEQFPDKLNAKVKIGNTYGEDNFTFGETFMLRDKDDLCIINSYYHYTVKYNQNGKIRKSEPILNKRKIKQFLKENNIKEYAIWRTQNGKPELEYCTTYED